MQVYKFLAVDKKGTRFRGTVRAISDAEARIKLAEKGYKVTALRVDFDVSGETKSEEPEVEQLASLPRPSKTPIKEVQATSIDTGREPPTTNQNPTRHKTQRTKFIAVGFGKAAALATDTRRLLAGTWKLLVITKRAASLARRITSLKQNLGEEAVSKQYCSPADLVLIAELNAKIVKLKATGGQHVTPEAERREVYDRIANVILDEGLFTNDELPSAQPIRGLIAEYDQLQTSKSEVQQRHFPPNGKGWARIAAGVALPLLLAAIAVWWISSLSIFSSGKVIQSTNQDTEVRSALGWVVAGLQISGGKGDVDIEYPAATGTAFAVTSNGYLLTNKHVVAEYATTLNDANALRAAKAKYGVTFKPKLWVFFGKEKYEATLIHQSIKFDFAILKVPRSEMPYFALSNTGARRGETVAALGFPGASRVSAGIPAIEAAIKTGSRKVRVEENFEDSDYDYTFTSGEVSRPSVKGVADLDSVWIQHLAQINHGNSGGPLVEKTGSVVGINTLYQGAISDRTFYALSLANIELEIRTHIPKGISWVDK